MKTKTIRNLTLLLGVAASSLAMNSMAAQPLKEVSGGRTHLELAKRLGDSGRDIAPRSHLAKTASGQAMTRSEAAASYPRYRLIDLGTLGGPQSNNIEGARNIDNRNQFIASFETPIVDPNNYFGESNFYHAVLGRPNGAIVGLPFPAGIDAATNYSFAGDINAAGLMAGWVTNGLIDPSTDFPELRPVVWARNGSTVTDLGTFGGNSGQANQVNNQGEAAGVALNQVAENPDFASFMNGFFPATTQARAFLWRCNTLQDLGTLGGNDAVASAINENGVVFGMSYTDTGANETTGYPTIHPFLWTKGRMRDLGTLGGKLATPASVFAIGPWGDLLNERGQAVGTSTLPGDEFYHGFFWNGSSMVDLGTLGGNFSEALALNELGMVVGRADIAPDSPYHHAALWRAGQIRDLGVVEPCLNSTAAALDSTGQTVVGGLGVCTDDPDDLNYDSAFVWKRGKAMADLNDLLTQPSDLHIEFATGVNDRGVITANAFLPTGEVRAVLLVPAGE